MCGGGGVSPVTCALGALGEGGWRAKQGICARATPTSTLLRLELRGTLAACGCWLTGGEGRAGRRARGGVVMKRQTSVLLAAVEGGCECRCCFAALEGEPL